MTIHSALLTDLYQLTMAYSYWHDGIAEQKACYHLFYRRPPFKGNYAVSCGLQPVIDYLSDYQFKQNELDYLSTLKGSDDNRLFSDEFLSYLQKLQFSCDVDAIPEGELVFANEPILRITGPILQCQLIETPLVNLINFSSLIATKASRVFHAANKSSVIEFGLRRAQGPDGGLSASRSAYIGGCDSTSNVMAGRLYNIPVRGTVAHSYIMSYGDEVKAFEKFSQAMPGNTVLLVDTFNTLEGVKNAIKVGQQLRQQGHELQGVRLDSGDMCELSKATRQLLDAAGFTNTKIVASGDLDEYVIADYIERGSKIDVWGVGTRLSTSYDQPSLDSAYKLAAIQDSNQQWQYRLKKSDTPAKTTTPGIQQIRRFYKHNQPLGDIIYDELSGLSDTIKDSDDSKDLLVPIFNKGQLLYQTPATHVIRQNCINKTEAFLHANPKQYPVEIDKKLAAIKNQLLQNI